MTAETTETSRPRRVAVLAVGSELLQGQIVNRNAAWLSSRLEDLGFSVVTHLTVDDVQADIEAGLAQLAAAAATIFVTGGLGPTSDDLTRDAVAAFCGAKLEFHAASWDHIVARFKSLAMTAPESNRQQCFYPTGARVLTNDAGTANAFQVTAKRERGPVEMWVLPGPPREVEAVWTAHVEAALRERIPAAARTIKRSWRMIGAGESKLAEIVEPVVKGSGVWVAYRAHAPFVEVKVRFPAVEKERFAPLCARLTDVLSPWLWEQDDEDVAATFVSSLARYEGVEIYDGATLGHLAELLAPGLREAEGRLPPMSLITSIEVDEDPRATVEQCLGLDTDAEVALAVSGFKDSGDADGGAWAAGVRVGERTSIVERPALWHGTAALARQRRAVAALTVKLWNELLAGDIN
jgi:molybdenum cofactor synthesis domain-containing protein